MVPRHGVALAQMLRRICLRISGIERDHSFMGISIFKKGFFEDINKAIMFSFYFGRLKSGEDIVRGM